MKKKAPEITREEWLGELDRLDQLFAGRNTEALTTSEIMAKTGRSRDWVISRLRIAKAEGRLQVTKKRTLQIDGTLCHRPAYQILPKKS